MTTKILTVDDCRTMQELLSWALTDAGYDVQQAEDGVAGLKALDECSPDVIITDVNMPNLDGYQFVAEVRRLDRYRATPIIICSTDWEPQHKQKAREAGATACIIKPFKAATIVDAVRRVTS